MAWPLSNPISFNFGLTQRDNIRSYINSSNLFNLYVPVDPEYIKNTAVCIILLFSCARTQIQHTNGTEAATAESQRSAKNGD